MGLCSIPKTTLAVCIICFTIALTSCAITPDREHMGGMDSGHPSPDKSPQGLVETYIDKDGIMVGTRILAPSGYERIGLPEVSFGGYLRDLPVKPDGTRVSYYDGSIKSRDVHAVVIDIDVGDRDLQQCADSVIRLRAEYLYAKGQYDNIHFNFTNGFNAEYRKWMNGFRIKVQGNDVFWVEQSEYSTDYSSFRAYLDMVFAYAGTLSLSQEMNKIPIDELQIGDVFLKGGSPGHCVIVVDMAESTETGEKIFLLAQGYMPAQDIHILKNPSDDSMGPWYSNSFGETLITPEWEFTSDQLYRFDD